MSPIRKFDDYRSEEISSWEEYVEEEIVGMQERGELDHLPDQGKPIKIWKTDVNPEYDLAFSRLKNAGVVPLWMELDQEIARRTDQIWATLDQTEQLLKDTLEKKQYQEPEERDPASTWWNRLRMWFRTDFSDEIEPAPTVTEMLAMRERESRRFLELAAELDKKIVAYHDSLPAGAEHLQQLRWLPERAARIFDERIHLGDWWQEVEWNTRKR